jgi:hypothetical protein
MPEHEISCRDESKIEENPKNIKRDEDDKMQVHRWLRDCETPFFLNISAMIYESSA